MDISEFEIAGAVMAFKAMGKPEEEIRKEYGKFWSEEELDKIFALMKEI